MSEKLICPKEKCKSDKILLIKEGLAKCLMCGTYFTPATSKNPIPHFYRLEVTPRQDEIRELAAMPLERVSEIDETKTSELSSDMITFIGRVAERLAPLTGLDEHAKARALEIQNEIRRELTDVFHGKGDYNKWYDQTKTKFGLHNQTFVSLLQDSLQGLNSQEAQELQQEYAQTLARMRRT